MTVPGEPLAYFLAHVDNDTEDCILWPYNTNKRGYGYIWLDNRSQGVHVLACERRHGPRLSGTHAAHVPVICHQPACFNPRHLSWRTAQQNAADKVLDGTNNTGERHGNAKLTWEQVAEIRARYAVGGITQQALADEYGSTQGDVSHILNQHAWKV